VIIICDIKLQEVHTVKDLGVKFDEQLKFSDHCYDKIKKAYSMLGLIKRNFNLLYKDSFVMLYKRYGEITPRICQCCMESS